MRPKFEADRDHIEILERFDIPHEVLGRQAIKALEPELSDKIGMAVLFPKNRSMDRNFYKLVLALADRFTALGGRIERGEVTGFVRSDRIREVVLKDGRKLPADEVVICAGAFSARLSRLLDEPIPLETERGYHTQIMAPGISMKHSIIWPARAFMVTPPQAASGLVARWKWQGLTLRPTIAGPRSPSNAPKRRSRT